MRCVPTVSDCSPACYSVEVTCGNCESGNLFYGRQGAIGEQTHHHEETPANQ